MVGRTERRARHDDGDGERHQNQDQPRGLQVLAHRAGEEPHRRVADRDEDGHAGGQDRDLRTFRPAVRATEEVEVHRDPTCGTEPPDDGGDRQAGDESQGREGVVGQAAGCPLVGIAHEFFSVDGCACAPVPISSIRKATASSAAEMTSR